MFLSYLKYEAFKATFPFTNPYLFFSNFFFLLSWCLPLPSAGVDSNLPYDTGKPAVKASPSCPQPEPCRSESPWLCPTVVAVGGSPANIFAEHGVRLAEKAPFK